MILQGNEKAVVHVPTRAPHCPISEANTKLAKPNLTRALRHSLHILTDWRKLRREQPTLPLVLTILPATTQGAHWKWKVLHFRHSLKISLAITNICLI